MEGWQKGDTSRADKYSTYRVVCGTEVRDFYFDDNADLVMVQGDVIYTLERPTGMDPQQYKAGYSGPSFDCAAAKTTGERLICADAALSKSDKSTWRSLQRAQARSICRKFRDNCRRRAGVA